MTADSGETLPTPLQVLERLNTLTESLETVASTLAGVSSSFTRARRQGLRIVVALGISFAVDIALTIVVTLLSVTSLNNSAAIHASQLTACSIGNVSRAEQVQLWEYVLQLSGGVHTGKQKAFEQFVHTTFAPVNCAQLYK